MTTNGDDLLKELKELREEIERLKGQIETQQNFIESLKEEDKKIWDRITKLGPPEKFLQRR